MKLIEKSKKYFDYFSSKDLDNLEKMFCEEVGLRDWESTNDNCDLIAVIDSPFQSSSIMEDENNEDGFVFGNTNNFEQRDNEVAPQVIPEEMEIDIDDI